MIRALLLSVAGISMVCGAARAEITIAGHVLDENNAPVALAVVLVRTMAESPGPAVQASTGPAGNFALRLSRPGKFLVTVTRFGFFPLKDKPLELGGNTREIQLVLNHETEIFSSVEVRERPDGIDLQQTESQRSLSSLDILNIPYQGRDVSNALKLLPGVVQDAQGGVHLSGSALNQVLYTLDGFNITNPLTGTFQTRLNIDAVRSIDYSKARYSPEFGKGSAGAVAISTRMGTDAFHYDATNFVPGVDTAGGPHIGTWSPRVQLSGPLVKKKVWFSESADATYSQLVVDDVAGRNRVPTLRLSDLLRVQANLSATNQLFASFLVNSSAARGTGLSALDPYSTTLDRRSRTWFFSLKQNQYLQNGAALEWGYAENRTFARQIPQGGGIYDITPYGRSGNYFLDSAEESGRKQFLANLSPRAMHLGGTHQLRMGVDADRLSYHARNLRTGYELWGLNGKRLNQVTFVGNNDFSRPNLEVSSYLLDSWKPRRNLTVEAGVRQDWDELLRNVVLSPRLSAAWSPFGWKNTKLTGGYAVTRDSTSLAEFSRPLDQRSVSINYGPDGNPTSLPMITYFVIPRGGLRTPFYRNWSAGMEQRLPRNTSLTAEFVSKRGQDGLTYLALAEARDPAVNGLFVLRNYRRDVFDSIEVTARQTFGDQYGWMTSYTRSRALSNAVLDLSVDQPLWAANNVGRMPWDAPNHFLAWGHFPTPLRNWSVSCLVEARDGFPYSVVNDWQAILGEVNAYRFPPYFTLDLHLERRLRLGRWLVALRGGMTNITNHQNPTVVNNVMGGPEFLEFFGSPGRHVVFRLRWLGLGNK